MSDEVCKHAFKQLTSPPNLIREMELFALAYICSGFCLSCLSCEPGPKPLCKLQLNVYPQTGGDVLQTSSVECTSMF